MAAKRLCTMNDKEANSPPQLRRGQPRRSRGWGGAVQENSLLDQHHPGASRHPSSSEEGNFPFPVVIWILLYCICAALPLAAQTAPPDNMVLIPAGKFWMGRSFSMV